jgi:ribosome biogenesis SPOUT family RNA methylase Rps3
MKYIIEHFGKAYKWHLIEYEHISKLVGKENLIFTNTSSKPLAAFGKVEKKSIAELDFSGVCILDPASDKILTPEDCKRFKYLIFGGILGDYPPRERTNELLTSRMPNAETRNLGKEQMPTDNAVYAAKLIADGTKFEDINFIDTIEVGIEEGLSVELPFRYVNVNGKPLISKKLVEFLKKRKTI